MSVATPPSGNRSAGETPDADVRGNEHQKMEEEEKKLSDDDRNSRGNIYWNFFFPDVMNL